MSLAMFPGTGSNEELSYAKLPKVSLHDHLDSGISPKTLIELAAKEGYKLPTTDPVALQKWFRDSSTSGSLNRYLESFEHTLAVMQSAENIERIAYEYVGALAADGVVYGETRYAPEQHCQNGLSMADVVEAVQRGLDRGMDEQLAKNVTILVTQILCAMTNGENSLEVAQLAHRYLDQGVVGFDTAGPEAGFLPSLHKPAFDYCLENFVPVTCHSGEAGTLENIREAVTIAHALRLGHGVRTVQDMKFEESNDEELTVTLGPLAQWIRDRNITLEMCPTSNFQTGSYAFLGEDMADHPVDLMLSLGFNVTINTDNRLMSDVSLTSEFDVFAQVFDWTVEDFLQVTVNAARSSFLPIEDRAELEEYLLNRYQQMM